MHRKRHSCRRASRLESPTLHYSITPFSRLLLYLSIYIEQHGKMYLPINCFHRGSLALYAALWKGLVVLRRDGEDNALS
jgi:hypothetical protein